MEDEKEEKINKWSFTSHSFMTKFLDKRNTPSFTLYIYQIVEQIWILFLELLQTILYLIAVRLLYNLCQELNRRLCLAIFTTSSDL